MPCDLCDGGDVDVMVPWGRATFPPPAGQGDLPAEVQSAQANSTFLDKGWRGLLGLSQPEAEGEEQEETDCLGDLCLPIFYRKEGSVSDLVMD